MIDFWELAGRLMLMDPTQRKNDIYTTILPIQSDGCILLGFSTKPTLPFPPAGFYNQLRDYFTQIDKAEKFVSPVLSMFALGETGVMFFNQKFRDLFEVLSFYLTNVSAASGKSDTGSSSLVYIVLALLMLDSTTRASVATGKFLGLEPSDGAEKGILIALANDLEFTKRANAVCFVGAWTEGSANTLRDQTYGTLTHANSLIGEERMVLTEEIIPFRHFRFVPGI